MGDRDQELRDVPHRPPDQSKWPKGIRSISIDEAGALGVDTKGELYWHGKPVEIRRPLDLTWRQKLVAGIVATATVIAAIGAAAQGWAAPTTTGPARSAGNRWRVRHRHKQTDKAALLTLAVLDVHLGSVHRSGASGGFGGTILLCGSRRFGGFTSKCSGLCGGSPFRHSRLALLRIAQRGRCNRLTICDTECVGHKVISSRSSSSVQRDI